MKEPTIEVNVIAQLKAELPISEVKRITVNSLKSLLGFGAPSYRDIMPYINPEDGGLYYDVPHAGSHVWYEKMFVRPANEVDKAVILILKEIHA